MLPIYGLLVNLVVTLVTAGLVFAVWVSNRRRIAAETVGRAEEQALRTLKDAERDAETRKKEALLEAKEKAHELLVDAERRQEELAGFVEAAFICGYLGQDPQRARFDPFVTVHARVFEVLRVEN